MAFTTQQKIDALKREVGFRMRVYPPKVSGGQMKEEEAAYQLAIMKAILNDYERQYTEGQLSLI